MSVISEVVGIASDFVDALVLQHENVVELREQRADAERHLEKLQNDLHAERILRVELAPDESPYILWMSSWGETMTLKVEAEDEILDALRKDIKFRDWQREQQRRQGR